MGGRAGIPQGQGQGYQGLPEPEKARAVKASGPILQAGKRESRSL